jgi:TonB family protein
MRPRLFAASAVMLMLGCAEPPYYSTYQLEGDTTVLRGESAESAHKEAVNFRAMTGSPAKFDAPIQLLRAPQPEMSREDIDAQVIGRVVVELHFSEAGTVERARILESTKQSLSDSVVAAVSRWAIAPLTSGGKPAKVVARQSFNFRTAR